MSDLKLFMVLIGCRPPGRHVEQHDVFFGIAGSLKELSSELKKFWPKTLIHIDAWREISVVDGHTLSISEQDEAYAGQENKKLFFINLGGYQANKFEEQHYIVLTVKPDKKTALQEAKSTLFFRESQLRGAAATHIDDTYGIDVDDLYLVEEILPGWQKKQYHIRITESPGLPDDPIQLGYIKLANL